MSRNRRARAPAFPKAWPTIDRAASSQATQPQRQQQKKSVVFLRLEKSVRRRRGTMSNRHPRV